jgi:hypothetical protein
MPQTTDKSNASLRPQAAREPFHQASLPRAAMQLRALGRSPDA